MDQVNNVNDNIIDSTIEVFKQTNIQNERYICIKSGKLTTHNDSNLALSPDTLDAIDQYVQKNCLQNPSQSEKQLALLKQVKIYYSGLKQKISTEADKVAQASSGVISATKPSNPILEIFKKLDHQIDKQSSFLDKIIKQKAFYEEQRKKTLDSAIDLALIKKQAKALPSSYTPPSPLKALVSLGLRNENHSPALEEVGNKYSGQTNLSAMLARASETTNLCSEISYSNNQPNGVHTDEEIRGLHRLNQNRINTSHYSILLEQPLLIKDQVERQQSIENIVVEIQNNIDLLETPPNSPPSDKVIELSPDSTCFVIPGGWAGHYISYKFKKEGDDYIFEIHNRGDESSDPTLHGKVKFSDPTNGKTFIKSVVRIKTSKEALKNPLFLKNLIEAKIFSSNSSYKGITEHFLTASPGKEPLGKIIESPIEKQLIVLYEKFLTADESTKVKITKEALTLMKKDKCFHAQQLIGSCTESNFLTTEEEMAPKSVRKTIEMLALTRKVNDYLVSVSYPFTPSPYDKPAHVNFITERVLEKINKLKNIILTSGGTNSSLPRQVINKQELSAQDREKIIEKLARNNDFQTNYHSLPKIFKEDPQIALAVFDVGVKSMLHDPSSKLTSNKEFMLGLIKKDFFHIEKASLKLRGDPEFIRGAKNLYIEALNYAAETLSLDEVLTTQEKERYIVDLKNGKISLKNLPAIFKRDSKIVNAAKENNIDALNYAADTLRADEVLNPAERAKLIDDLKKGKRFLFDPSTGKFLPPLFLNDPTIVLAAIEYNALALEHASATLRGTLEIVIAAKNKNIHALHFVAENLKIDQIFSPAEKNKLLDDLKKGKLLLAEPDGTKPLPSLLRDNTEIVLAAIEFNGIAIKDASNKIKALSAVVNAAINKNVLAIDYLLNPESIVFFPEDIAEYTSKLKTGEKTLLSYPKVLRSNSEIISAALEFDGLAIKYATDSLKKNREIALKAVKKNGMALQYLIHPLNTDETILAAAIKQNPHAIQFCKEINISLIKSSLSADISVIKHLPKVLPEATIKQLEFLSPLVLQGIKDKKISLADLPLYLRKVPALVLKAVQNNPLDLEFASPELKENLEIVTAANTNIYALEFASPKLKLNQIYSTKEKFKQLINGFKTGKLKFQNAVNGKLLPEIFRDNKDIALAAVENNGSALQHVSDRLRKDIDVVKASKNELWSTLEYAHESLPLDKILSSKEKAHFISLLKEGKITFNALPNRLKKDPAMVSAAAMRK